ncbi:hypothetical protein KKC22_02620 [Myxococcota bacterium]|nr:hypothetical protein [Myxococcota bacterium]
MEYHCRIRNHGRQQLELEVDYPLVPNQPKTAYSLEALLFTPASMNITKSRYGVEAFFNNLVTYTRYTVAPMPLALLIDPDNDKSPLTRITRRLDTTPILTSKDQEELVYEIKTLSNIYAFQLRRRIALIGESMARMEPASLIDTTVEQFVTNIGLVLERYRGLHTRFLEPGIDEFLREAYRWTDELMSLVTEREQFALHRDLVAAGYAGTAAAVNTQLHKQEKYRLAMHYPSVVCADTPIQNEVALYRGHMLKKWSESAMYMGRTPNRMASQVGQVLMGIAAGAAMAFAVTAAFLTDQLFATYSLPWALMIILAYVFKDRIKEILRAFFIRYVPHLVSDRMEDLIDPAIERKVGVSRARVRFSDARAVPADVLRIRNQTTNPFRHVLKPENVIHFQKEIHLNSPRLADAHARLESITEIIRMRLSSWFTMLDEPLESRDRIEGDEVISVECRRVYHVHLVLKLSEKGKEDQASIYHYVIIITRDGIERIDSADG